MKFLFHYLQRITRPKSLSNSYSFKSPAQPLQRLVVKPDQLIKRRGKLGLVGINLTLDQVKAWLKQRLGQETTVRALLLFPGQYKSCETTAPLQPAPVFWLMIECYFRPYFNSVLPCNIYFPGNDSAVLMIMKCLPSLLLCVGS